MSRTEVASAIGVSAQSVYYWETNQRMPRADQLQRFAALFGVCMDNVALPIVPSGLQQRKEAPPDGTEN